MTDDLTITDEGADASEWAALLTGAMRDCVLIAIGAVIALVAVMLGVWA